MSSNKSDEKTDKPEITPSANFWVEIESNALVVQSPNYLGFEPNITRDSEKNVEFDNTYPSAGYTSRLLGNFLNESEAAHRMASVCEFLSKSSEVSGGYVHLLPDLSFCPSLIDRCNRPVFLYDLVEVLDGLIDYDDIKKEFPDISFAQISGALAFLRKVSQFNSKGVDIDELEDKIITEDENLLDEIRTALADQENLRVLDDEESDRS